MKPLRVLFPLAAAVLLVFACVDDDDGREACDALASKCLPVTGRAKCDYQAINAHPSASIIEDCVQAAPDCDAATACLAPVQQ
ncbi:MAG: hypothetical protein KIT84_25515 [Labilithrix sp.]|nr:hypothetical protein [Labilithrix sp.]MCW5814411.1 hypothetical protein [Labilithrix sp.]